MKKHLASTLLLFFTWYMVIPSFAQLVDLPEVTIPDLPQSGADVLDFVPPNWRIELSENGDLGGDGSRKDYLLLLKMQDENNILHNDGCSLDTNPRLLVFLLARNGGYFLAGQNGTLIPRSDSFCDGDDPIDGVTGGGITIGGESGREAVLELGFFGSSLGHISFSFAWLDDAAANSAVYLLKRTHSSRHRYYASHQEIQVDYLKQQVTCVDYGDDEDEDITDHITNERTTPFISEAGIDSPLLRLEEVGMGYEFEWGCQ